MVKTSARRKLSASTLIIPAPSPCFKYSPVAARDGAFILPHKHPLAAATSAAPPRGRRDARGVGGRERASRRPRLRPPPAHPPACPPHSGTDRSPAARSRLRPEPDRPAPRR